MLILGEIIYKQEEVVREPHSDWVISGREGPLREHRDRGDLGRLWLWPAREDQGLGVSAVSKRCGIVSIGEVRS